MRALSETYCCKRKTAVEHNHIALKEYTGDFVVKLHEFCTTALDGGRVSSWMSLSWSLRSLKVLRKRILPITEMGVNTAGYITFNLSFCGPGSVVGIATAYGLDGPGIESRWGRDFPHRP